MNTKRRVTVKIYGQEYNMVGSESRDYIQSIANYVDDKMHYIAESSKQLNTQMVAVLTSLNIADEYMKAKEEIEAWKTKLQEPLESLDKARSELAVTRNDMEDSKTEYEEAIRLLEEEKKALIMALSEKEDVLKSSNELKSELEMREKEVQTLLQEKEELQNKVFDSHIKYVQAKKELDSFIDTFDEKSKK